MKTLPEQMIFTARAGEHRYEFGIAQCAAKGNNPAKNPKKENGKCRGNGLKLKANRHEDADTDHAGHNHADGGGERDLVVFGG